MKFKKSPPRNLTESDLAAESLADSMRLLARMRRGECRAYGTSHIDACLDVHHLRTKLAGTMKSENVRIVRSGIYTFSLDRDGRLHVDQGKESSNVDGNDLRRDAQAAGTGPELFGTRIGFEPRRVPVRPATRGAGDRRTPPR